MHGRANRQRIPAVGAGTHDIVDCDTNPQKSAES